MCYVSGETVKQIFNDCLSICPGYFKKIVSFTFTYEPPELLQYTTVNNLGHKSKMKILKTNKGYEVNIHVNYIFCPFRQGYTMLVISFHLNLILYTIGVQTACFLWYAGWVNVCNPWERERTTYQASTTVGFTPAARDKVRRQGLMRRVIPSLPCQVSTCHSILSKKPHICPFINIPHPLNSNFTKPRPPVTMVIGGSLLVCLLDSSISIGILIQYSGHA